RPRLQRRGVKARRQQPDGELDRFGGGLAAGGSRPRPARGAAPAAPPPGPAGFAGVLPHLALSQPWRGHFVASMAVCSCAVGAGLLRPLAWALGADCLTARRLRPAACHASGDLAPSNG